VQALGLVPLVTGATTRLMNSALPDAPVVVARSPGPVRMHTACILREVADRLARTDDPIVRHREHWAQ
jgi:hypothetical protein